MITIHVTDGDDNGNGKYFSLLFDEDPSQSFTMKSKRRRKKKFCNRKLNCWPAKLKDDDDDDDDDIDDYDDDDGNGSFDGDDDDDEDDDDDDDVDKRQRGRECFI